VTVTDVFVYVCTGVHCCYVCLCVSVCLCTDLNCCGTTNMDLVMCVCMFMYVYVCVCMYVYVCMSVYRRELLWYYQDGASRIFPDSWDRFIAPIPVVRHMHSSSISFFVTLSLYHSMLYLVTLCHFMLLYVTLCYFMILLCEFNIHILKFRN